MYQLWKWKAFVHVIIITTTATIMHHHPQLATDANGVHKKTTNSTRTTPPHHHHHFTCQLHYHVKPFPIHRHCTILQLYLWIMVMLMVLIYYYPPPHLNDVSLGYLHPQWPSTMRRKRWWQWWCHKYTDDGPCPYYPKFACDKVLCINDKFLCQLLLGSMVARLSMGDWHACCYYSGDGCK